MLKLSPDLVARRLRAMHEANPMLGFRGCRLGIVHPEITTMQVGAVMDAAIAAARAGPRDAPPPRPHIMLPLVAFPEEFRVAAETVHAAAAAAQAGAGPGAPVIEYTVGTMIELPRAALAAGELTAAGAQFFSVGSNDMTQCALGVSRDDAAVRFLPAYLKAGILGADPFQTVDVDGVGELVRTAVDRGRAARPGLEVGVCGEHGGDPASIAFFAGAGVDYVSCSPLRVPVARLAAAQAAVRARGKDALAHCQD
jgi:pyruvate,orthophosphate dikinase